MTQRASESLVAVLIRIGLLLVLAILFMAENAQAQKFAAPVPITPAAQPLASPICPTLGSGSRRS